MVKRKLQITRLSEHKIPYIAFHDRHRRAKNLSPNQVILHAAASVCGVAIGILRSE